ncbi:MAG: type II toxin-antitoxin system HipA family toxin [Pseudomonadota bacterium]
MDRETLVYVALGENDRLVGRLWTRVRRGRESATFQYDDAWLEDPERFALEPALSLGPGAHHTAAGRANFGALGDSAPDRWGRALMGRAERRLSRAEERAPRTLTELDFLLQVSDRSRQGALRFKAKPDGPFLGDAGAYAVPPLIELPRLLAASDRVLDEDDDALLALLLAPGSSLGGARPKASVVDMDGALAIAKFPKHDDDIDVVRWEAVALTLASRAGIDTAAWRLERPDNRSVLIVRRFDRDGAHRIPYLSAMSMLGANDGDQRSYLEIADALRQHGASATVDRQALWRRIVFSVLISNTDDHLRNHGFLYDGTAGWRLSPAFDLNPVPIDLKSRFLSTAIDLEDNAASIELALSVAHHFALDADSARAVAKDVANAVADWRQVAAELALQRGAIERMASAFEHADLQMAQAF